MDLLQQELVDFSNKRSTSTQFKNYQDYIDAQTKQGLSFEKDNTMWSEGQARCIEAHFSNIDRSARILDICCGDGRGLKKLLEMGFTDITGVEISDEKIAYASSIHNNIIKQDICCGPFHLGEKYDIIYSSHTIEHVLHPEYTIQNILRFLKDDGLFFLILPYPDIAASNPSSVHRFKVHCGVMPLGLHIHDKGETICTILRNWGFNILHKEFHNFREPEIHLTIKKI